MGTERGQGPIPHSSQTSYAVSPGERQPLLQPQKPQLLAGGGFRRKDIPDVSFSFIWNKMPEDHCEACWKICMHASPPPDKRWGGVGEGRLIFAKKMGPKVSLCEKDRCSLRKREIIPGDPLKKRSVEKMVSL